MRSKPTSFIVLEYFKWNILYIVTYSYFSTSVSTSNIETSDFVIFHKVSLCQLSSSVPGVFALLKRYTLITSTAAKRHFLNLQLALENTVKQDSVNYLGFIISQEGIEARAKLKLVKLLWKAANHNIKQKVGVSCLTSLDLVDTWITRI